MRPAASHRVDFEAELVAVIGKKAKNVSAAEALGCLLGYTCGNDVTARDLQPKNGQWTISKSFDTFLSIGPWIETELDSSALDVAAHLNGERKQGSNTKNLIFPVPELIAYLSSVMTLEPGDIIMTGTPSGVGPMAEGDEIVIEIEASAASSTKCVNSPSGPVIRRAAVIRRAIGSRPARRNKEPGLSGFPDSPVLVLTR